MIYDFLCNVMTDQSWVDSGFTKPTIKSENLCKQALLNPKKREKLSFIVRQLLTYRYQSVDIDSIPYSDLKIQRFKNQIEFPDFPDSQGS